MLNLYVDLVDTAEDLSCITLAFGVNDLFKDQLKDNTAQSHITFLLLEKKDKPRKNAKKPFVKITASNNVYKAWGSYIQTAVYQWARETWLYPDLIEESSGSSFAALRSAGGQRPRQRRAGAPQPHVTAR